MRNLQSDSCSCKCRENFKKGIVVEIFFLKKINSTPESSVVRDQAVIQIVNWPINIQIQFNAHESPVGGNFQRFCAYSGKFLEALISNLPN